GPVWRVKMPTRQPRERLLRPFPASMTDDGSAEHFHFVLEPTRFDRAVHTALLRSILFPPPASRPGVSARLDRPRARRAADALIALRIQRVRRHVVVADVIPDLFVGPVGKWIDLDDAAVVVVQLDLADVGTGRPLVAP